MTPGTSDAVLQGPAPPKQKRLHGEQQASVTVGVLACTVALLTAIAIVLGMLAWQQTTPPTLPSTTSGTAAAVSKNLFAATARTRLVRRGPGYRTDKLGVLATSTESETSGLQMLADASGTWVMQGEFTLLSAGGSDVVVMYVLINGKFTKARLSTTWAGLYVPGVPPGKPVVLDAPIYDVGIQCGDALQPVPSKTIVRFGSVVCSSSPYPPASMDEPDLPVLGVGPLQAAPSGAQVTPQYVSPVLGALQRAGLPIALSFRASDQTVTVSLCVRSWQCLTWCWVPMSITAGLYIMPLIPRLPGAPWTDAVIDFGKYLSTMPTGSSPDTSGHGSSGSSSAGGNTVAAQDAALAIGIHTIELTFASPRQCTLLTQRYTYTTAGVTGPNIPRDAPGTRRCALGMSAGLRNTLFALDASNGRFGIVKAL